MLSPPAYEDDISSISSLTRTEDLPPSYAACFPEGGGPSSAFLMLSPYSEQLIISDLPDAILRRIIHFLPSPTSLLATSRKFSRLLNQDLRLYFAAKYWARNSKMIIHTSFCDERFFQKLVDRGINVNADNDYALVNFTQRGKFSTVELLLRHGADPNARNGEPLNSASTNGYHKIAELLIQYGASVTDGVPLQGAVVGNHLKVVSVLLEKGADPNKGALLKKAIQAKLPTICIHLMRAGASIGRFTEELIKLAIEFDSIEIIQFLQIRKINLWGEGEQHLSDSAAKGNTELFQLLLDSSSEIPTTRDRLLKTAAGKGHIKVLQALISKGPPLSQQNLHELLIVATRQGSNEIIKALEGLGADLHRDDDAPFRCAAEEGWVETVKFLHEKGANHRARENWALKKSSQKGHFEVVQFLLELESNPAILQEGLTMALRGGNHQVISLYYSKGIEPPLPVEKKKSGFFSFFFGGGGSTEDESANFKARELALQQQEQNLLQHLQQQQQQQQPPPQQPTQQQQAKPTQYLKIL